MQQKRELVGVFCIIFRNSFCKKCFVRGYLTGNPKQKTSDMREAFGGYWFIRGGISVSANVNISSYESTHSEQLTN